MLIFGPLSSVLPPLSCAHFFAAFAETEPCNRRKDPGNGESDEVATPHYASLRCHCSDTRSRLPDSRSPPSSGPSVVVVSSSGWHFLALLSLCIGADCGCKNLLLPPAVLLKRNHMQKASQNMSAKLMMMMPPHVFSCRAKLRGTRVQPA